MESRSTLPHELRHLDIANPDQLALVIVAENPIRLTGSLAPNHKNGVSTVEDEIGSVAADAPSAIAGAVEEYYGEGLCSRERDLIASGARLAVLMMVEWASSLWGGCSDNSAAEQSDVQTD